MKENACKIIVVGAGAAGIFAAVNIARLHPQSDVIIIEKSNKLLSKVKVSGGGRCNVTHSCFELEMLIKNYPRGFRELRSVFARFMPTDTIAWFKERGVELKTEEDGRMFPVSNNSQTIIDCLLNEAEKYNVKIWQGLEIKEIKKTESFNLSLSDGQEITCDKLIVASGGSPKSVGYEWINKLGHSIVSPVPSLFTFNIKDKAITRLMGISVPQAIVSISNTKLVQEGPLLITHWGFSGPAILKLSAWGARILNEADYKYTVRISWLTDYNENTLKEKFNMLKKHQPDSKIINTNNFHFPQRLWEYFLERVGIHELRWADVSNKNINKLIQILINDTYEAEGKTTFKEEFVTCGGINLKEVDFRTMESKIIPGLHFAGEVLDIDGVTGGFNFQAAWATGWVAANAAAKQS